ncbi:hypothetical protein [Bacillus massilinigeriensis]|uniref:hypothetical protein n=1 Tax=Bacillus mediterraneensis TaxID=1805474 RepID=UPI0008F7EFCB|nr:hypothetical protein [Bacillus mediterraneensis]
MSKNRYLLCFLLCGLLCYYALPLLPLNAAGAGGAFALSWLLLASFVAAGNLSAFLYGPRKQKRLLKDGVHLQKKVRGRG